MRANQFTSDATERHKRNRYIRRLHQMTGWDTSHLELLSNDELRDLHIQHQQERNSEPNEPTDEAMSAGVRMQRALQREKEKRERSERYAEKHFPIGKPKEEPKKEPNMSEAEGEEDYYYRVRHQTKRDIELEMPPKSWDSIGPMYATYEEAKAAFEQLKAKHPHEKFTYTRHPRTSHVGGKPERVFPEGVAEGDKKPHPKTWHDVDPKLGKQVDKMSQAEKVKKGLAHPDTLKKQGVAEGLCEVCGTSLAEHGKASLKLCKSSRPDSELGASNLASCKSQGLRARDGDKSHKLGRGPESRVKVGGHKIKGKKYGGPLPDWS